MNKLAFMVKFEIQIQQLIHILMLNLFVVTPFRSSVIGTKPANLHKPDGSFKQYTAELITKSIQILICNWSHSLKKIFKNDFID